MQLNPTQLSHLLDVWPIARLASLGSGRQPHLVPIVFVALDGAIYSPIDGKPKRGATLQRIHNVAAEPSVSLLLDRYDDDWDLLWWVRIDANAEVVSGSELTPPALQRIEDALRLKYPQYRTVAPFSGVPTLLRLTPTGHNAWSARPVVWEALR